MLCRSPFCITNEKKLALTCQLVLFGKSVQAMATFLCYNRIRGGKKSDRKSERNSETKSDRKSDRKSDPFIKTK